MPASTSSRPLRRLIRDRIGLLAAGALAFVVLAALIGPVLSPYEESAQALDRAFEPPSAGHWFGLDSLGRDLLTRTFLGGRISLAVGLAGAAIGLVIGVGFGGIAGFAGGRVEAVLMRMIDFLYAVPLLLVVIALMVVLGQGLANVFIALGLVYWLGMARVVRARVAELRSREFVEAARVLGQRPSLIFLRHIVPNASGVILVTATFMIPEAIFAESFLSFLGLGVTLPHASWGTLASEGLQAMRSHPHVLAFPAAAICLTMLAFQTFGEALRRALDPRESELD
jgi:oligopeptide transport system permease protein